MTLRALWLGAGWAFVVLVIYLSLNTNPVDVGRFEDVKVGHFVAYGWLMLWFAQTSSRLMARGPIALAFVVMGVALEYAQGVSGYRSFAYSDMRDNAFGVGIGFALAWTPLGNLLASLEARVGQLRLRRTA